MEIDELAELATSKFGDRAEKERESPGFADAVHEIYTVDSKSRTTLKETVVQVCNKHAGQLFGVGISIDRDSRIWHHKLHKVFFTIPDFRNELMGKSTSSRREWDVMYPEKNQLVYKCGHREDTFVERSESMPQRKNRLCPYCRAKEESFVKVED